MQHALETGVLFLLVWQGVRFVHLPFVLFCVRVFQFLLIFVCFEKWFAPPCVRICSIVSFEYFVS